MTSLTPLQQNWLYALQRPWPLVERPLQALATTLHTTESALCAFLDELRTAGLVRRIGAVFDARRLGYRSCLFALTAHGEALEAAARRLCAHPGITHAYTRGWPEGLTLGGLSASDYAPYPNLWYTLSAPADDFSAHAATLADLAPQPFPALTRFKIDVVFDARTRNRDERTEYRGEAIPPAQALTTDRPSPTAIACVRRYQGDTATPEAPFRAEDLPLLNTWQADGTLRRFALLLKHRAGGFIANGMCCWAPPEAELLTLGRRLAQEPDVTHCYARPAAPNFPFTLYAMIHKTAWQVGFEAFCHLSSLLPAGTPGKVFFSTREFKKSSIHFFPE